MISRVSGRRPSINNREPDLQKIVFISAILHLVLIAFTFTSLKTKKTEFRDYYVNIVGPLPVEERTGNFKGHDAPMIARRTTSIDAREGNVSEEMDSEKIEEIAKEIERLRAIRRLSRQKEKGEEIDIIRKRIKEGVADTGGASHDGAGTSGDSYYLLISEKIWSHWVYPDIRSSGLEVVISIRIDRRGNIVSQEIEKSSGNSIFDQSALRAITKANPLPPPPAGAETEVGVRFFL